MISLIYKGVLDQPGNAQCILEIDSSFIER